jgi:hypothetical protein
MLVVARRVGVGVVQAQAQVLVGELVIAAQIGVSRSGFMSVVSVLNMVVFSGLC